MPEDDASDEEETKPGVHGNTEKSAKSGDGLENTSQNATKDVKSKVIIIFKYKKSIKSKCFFSQALQINLYIDITDYLSLHYFSHKLKKITILHDCTE